MLPSNKILKVSQMGHFVMVSLWRASLSTNTTFFLFFILFYFILFYFILFYFFFIYLFIFFLPGCSFRCYHLFSQEAQGRNVPNSLTVGMNSIAHIFWASHKQWEVAILTLINTSASIKFSIVEIYNWLNLNKRPCWDSIRDLLASEANPWTVELRYRFLYFRMNDC